MVGRIKFSKEKMVKRLKQCFDNVTILDYEKYSNAMDMTFSGTCRTCGKTFTKTINQKSLEGKVQSCGCLKFVGGNHGIGKQNRTWSGSKDGMIYGSHFTKIKLSAKRRKIPFDVDIEYLAEVLREQDYRCKYTSLGIQSGHTNGGRTASLDRIDSSKGYVEGNVQWVYKDIQFIKWKFEEDYFLCLVNRIINKLKDEEVNVWLCVREKPKYANGTTIKYGNIPQWLVGKWEQSASTRGIFWDLSGEFLWKLFIEQEGKCALTGINLTLPERSDSPSGSFNISLDRIDSSGHYTENNVQLVLKDINVMKNELSNELLVYYCRHILDC